MLDPLASVGDLLARTSRTYTQDEQLRAGVLLLDASAKVREYTGQQFTLVEDDTVRLRTKDGKLILPQRPVVDVTAVKDINGNDVLYTWDAGETIQVGSNVPDSWSYEPWRTGYVWLDVTYTHGYDEIPQTIIALVCQMAARALGVAPEDSGHQSESIAGYSYTVGAAAAAGAVGLLPDEKAALDEKWRNKPAGKIVMLQQ